MQAHIPRKGVITLDSSVTSKDPGGYATVEQDHMLHLLEDITEENQSKYSIIKALDTGDRLKLYAATEQGANVILVEIGKPSDDNRLSISVSVGEKDKQLINVAETKINASSTHSLQNTVQTLLDEFTTAIKDAEEMCSEHIPPNIQLEEFIDNSINIMDPMNYLDDKKHVADFLKENIEASMSDPNIPYGMPFILALYEDLQKNAKDSRNASSWEVVMGSMKKGTEPIDHNNETIDFIHWVLGGKDAPLNEKLFWQSIISYNHEAQLCRLIRSGVYTVQVNHNNPEKRDSDTRVGDDRMTLTARLFTAKLIEKLNLPNSALPLVDEGKLINMIDEFTKKYGIHNVGDGETKIVTLSDVIQHRKRLEEVFIQHPSDDEYPYS